MLPRDGMRRRLKATELTRGNSNALGGRRADESRRPIFGCAVRRPGIRGRPAARRWSSGARRRVVREARLSAAWSARGT